MTYRLEPIIEKIVSPVVLIFPDGNKKEYKSGAKACEDTFNHKYVAESIRATDNKIDITLSEADSLKGDESFF